MNAFYNTVMHTDIPSSGETHVTVRIDEDLSQFSRIPLPKNAINLPSAQ
jgi:hypothetical protein